MPLSTLRWISHVHIIDFRSFKSYHLHQIWVRSWTWSILEPHSPPTIFLMKLRQKLSASKMQWWDQHRTDIPTGIGRKWKDIKRGHFSQASYYPSMAHSLGFKYWEHFSVARCSVLQTLMALLYVPSHINSPIYSMPYSVKSCSSFSSLPIT